VSRAATPAGTAFDIYEPAGVPAGSYLLIYGLDLAGEKDPRLVRFAYACGAAGLRSAIPALPGLKSYRFDPGDLEALADLVNHLRQRTACPIGMIGFSAGGSIALLAACDERIAGWVDPLLLFSPYYSLDDLWITHNESPPWQPASPRDWEHYIWTQLVLAYLSAGRSGFSPEEREGLFDMLSRYCNEPIECKLDFYRRVLQGRPIPGLKDITVEPEILERFALRGKLNRVKGRVIILHDPADYLIPPEHSHMIHAELQQRGMAGSQRLLVTPLISHVTPHYAFRWREMIEIIDMFGELFTR
jgi:pimeloyl-ACP methyl ester carboxylesterase